MFPELITELLQDGYKVSFNAPGHSMFPTIMANESIMIEPIDPGTVRMGDIILYRTNGRLIAHRVVRIDQENNSAITKSKTSKSLQSNPFIEGDSPLVKRSVPQAKRSSNGEPGHSSAPQVKRSSNEVLNFVLRGDASPSYDAPVKAGQILGKVVSIERNGFSIDPYSFAHKLGCLAITWRARIRRLPSKILSFFLQNR